MIEGLLAEAMVDLDETLAGFVEIPDAAVTEEAFDALSDLIQTPPTAEELDETLTTWLEDPTVAETIEDALSQVSEEDISVVQETMYGFLDGWMNRGFMRKSTREKSHN